MSLLTPNQIRWGLKPLVFVVCLLPTIWMVWALFNNQLGVNPVEELTHNTGEWSLRFLLLSLAMTPLRLMTKSALPIRFRRMLGLYAFFYLVLHFVIYIYLDHLFSLASIWDDIKFRKFITVGFASFVLMIPLAVTSFRAIQRRMGRKWVKLHKLVYLCAILGLLHFVWLVKADYNEVLIYIAVFVVLMSFRLYPTIRRKLST